MEQAVNPYLPQNEYIPDGEPRIFNDRVYVYGSHDRFNAPIFCMNDYVCYSAHINNLAEWRYEGVIYKKDQDPMNKHGIRLFFAPDVVQGTDGKYYMYYTVDFSGVMSVAVCDTPAGEYKYLGNVKYPDGVKWGRKKGDAFCFDPGVLVDDDGRVYLYSGFYKRIPAILTGFKRLNYDGCYVVELKPDMLTMKSEPKLLFSKEGEGSFIGHEFFEASSIRKFNNKYYFVYSSKVNHELCYAVSDKPMEGYKFGGTLISNGDIGINEHKNEYNASNYIGNNHGGMLNINDKYYIFYHRHTNRHSYSRQTCVEEINMRSDGNFDQVEMTSCGLNRGLLLGNGIYEARIACNLWSSEGTGRYDKSFGKIRYRNHPYITQDKKDGDITAKQYIANIKDGAVIGFKYFEFINLKQIFIKVNGKAKGTMIVSTDNEFKNKIGEIPIQVTGTEWVECSTDIKMQSGKKPLFFMYKGKGKINFIEFKLV